MPKFRKIDRAIDKAELVCKKTDGTKYEFNCFTLPLKFIEKIHNYEITLNEAISDQVELEILINKLNNTYNPWSSKKVKEKNKVLESTKKLFDARKDIIVLLEKRIFPYKGNVFKTKEEEIKEYINNIFTFTEGKSKDVNNDLFAKYFNFSKPIGLAKKLYETKDAKENSEIVEEIKNG